MRLLDQIALAAVSGGGEQAARRVRETGLRYVVDAAASSQCFELVRADTGLLDPANPMLRMPAESCWVEWLAESSGELASHRLGALIESAPDGRSGVATPFWQEQACGAVAAPLSIAFDLDSPLSPPSGAPLARRISNAALPHLTPLFGHMICHLDPSWAAPLWKQGPLRLADAMRRQAEATWFNLPFVFALAALLSSDGLVVERPSDLARLNRARQRRGREPLLDHLEVGLTLAAERAALGVGGSGTRGAPRLHFVRGHPVRRGGTTFWRGPHLRGDPERPILSKTVSVRGAARQ